MELKGDGLITLHCFLRLFAGRGGRRRRSCRGRCGRPLHPNRLLLRVQLDQRPVLDDRVHLDLSVQHALQQLLAFGLALSHLLHLLDDLVLERHVAGYHSDRLLFLRIRIAVLLSLLLQFAVVIFHFLLHLVPEAGRNALTFLL